MAILDVKKNLIKGKIVYYGSGLCGKTTNLEYINRAMKGSQEMMSLATEGDRTIFFDFLPMDLGKIRGISTTFKLYTVPGQVRYNLTRKMVLKSVDGVVFVADSQLSMMDSNVESLENLFSNLRELGMNPDEIPIVLQYNKRDLPGIASPEVLDGALNRNGYPVFLASAVAGDGVLDTLKRITNIVFERIMATFEGRGTSTPPKRAAASKTPPRKTPLPQEPQAREAPEAAVVPAVRIGATTPPKPAAPQRTIPPTVPGRDQPEAVPDEARRRDLDDLRGAMSDLARREDLALDAHRKASEAAEKGNRELRESFAAGISGIREEISRCQKELDELRGAMSALARREDLALDTHRKASEAAERSNRDLRESVSAGISGIREEISRYRKEFDGLRGAMHALEEQVKAAGQPGAGARDVENARLLQRMSDGMATKQELSGLQQTVVGLSERTREILEAQRMISAQEGSLASVLARVEAVTEEHRRSTSLAISRIHEEIARHREAGAVRPDGGAPARKDASVPADAGQDPAHRNAARIARVMVADLELYHPSDVAEGIRNGDLHGRLKAQMEDMRRTYEARVPEDVRSSRDYLAEAIDDLVARKHGELGIEREGIK